MQSQPIAAVAIGPANCEAVTGVPWRYLRTQHPGLLKKIGERKHVILARDLETALASTDPRETSDVATLAAELGVDRG